MKGIMKQEELGIRANNLRAKTTLGSFWISVRH
jgi:hypothetical protein